MKPHRILAGVLATLGVSLASAQAQSLIAAQIAPGQNCSLITPANAAASAGTANVQHDGSPLPGITPPNIASGFGGIPRSAQPSLTASQQRILECTYRLAEANADMPYTLFVPASYEPGKPTPLIVDLHGLNITPLQQILFDGTTDLAARYGYIVVAPMGYNSGPSWGATPGNPVPTAQVKPGGTTTYGSGELSEIDTMKVVSMIRERYAIDPNRIYLMGHSMGGAGVYTLGAKYNDLWAGLVPIAGLRGIPTEEAAQAYKNIPMMLYHGAADSIVTPDTSRRSVLHLQSVGAPHLYVQVPGADHEFWIRRGAKNMERVFMFFNTVSKANTIGHITPEMAVAPPRGAGGPPGAGRGAGAPPGAGGPPGARRGAPPAPPPQ
jgi:poly(3-hydroxybutyrate) depolymerase